jgi:ferric-chelate reductase [NAD(P)H]
MDTKALTKIQYGIYIVSSYSDGKSSGQIVNTVFQITSDPVQLAVSLSKQNFTCELLLQSSKFAITALSEDAPFEFIGKFGFRTGRYIDKFENVQHIISENHIPIVTDYAAAVFETEVISKTDFGSHILFAGKVVDMQLINEKQNTMTYEYYHKVKGGIAAKNAPTYTRE